MKKFLPNVLMLICLIGFYTNVAASDNTIESTTKTCMDCLTAPILFCPSTYFGCPTDNIDPSNTGFPVAMPGDVNCPDPIVTYQDVIITNTPCMKVIHRTWLAEYPPGSASIKLHSQCQQTLVLEDSEAPIIENCPADLTVDLANNCAGTATWPIPTATDDCGIQYFITTHYSGTVFPLGVTPVTYTAQDWCGQQDTCTFNVTVVGSCCDGFAINCPSNQSLCVGSDITPSNTGQATSITNDPSCEPPIITYSDSIVSSGPCSGAMVIERTWTATDSTDASNFVSCTQSITLNDTQNPIITNIPQDVTVSASSPDCSTPFTWTPPIANDNCGLLSFDSNIANGATFTQGSTLVIYTATDNCNNTATAAFLVTVECASGCTTPPNLICPNPYTSCPSLNNPLPSESGYAIAFPGDTDCSQPTLSYSDIITSTGSCNGVKTIDRTWLAVDPSNSSLSTSCIQVISLEDNQAPIITNVPSDITVTGFGSSCQVPVNWTEPLYSDNCGVANWTSTIPNGSTLSQGVSTIVYTAEDNCGLTTTASFNITVNCISACNSNPIITGPANYWACPTGSIPNPSISGYATAVPGNADCNTPVVTYSDFILYTGPCPGAKVVERTWTATDPNNSNLSSTYVQVISLEDTQPPSMVYCPSDVTVNASNPSCTATASWSSPIAADNCNAPNLSATDQYGNAVVSGATFNQGINTITYTASDLCSNTATCSFNVIVTCAATCNSNPIITGPTNYWACPTGSVPGPSIAGYATAIPGSTYCSQPTVSYSDHLLYSGPCAGTKVIERTWTATDPYNSNLTSSYVQLISLEDLNPPSIAYCPSDVTVTADNSSCTKSVTWTSPLAYDNCGAPLLSSTDQNGNYVNSGAYFNQGVNTVTFVATDGCGNTADCSFNITVNCAPSCSTPPSITCPSNKVVCPGSSTSSSVLGWPSAYAGANCPNPTVTYQDIITSTGPCTGQKVINRTWTASYASGNNLSSSCVQVIQVKDQIAPSFNNCPGNIVVNDNTTLVNWVAPYATDFCTVPSVTSSHQPNSYFPVGTTTVTYTAVDNCGNSKVCQFQVTVLYDNNATLTCPDDLYLTCNSNGGAYADWAAPTYDGTCGNCNGNSIPGFIYMGTYNGHQYYCSTSQATWSNAQTVCASNGGYLASIDSAGENQFLADILTLQSAWIGLSDVQNEGTFQWDNGDNLTYTNWYPGQPNNYNNSQDYVEMLNNGLWNDQYNHYALEYIMELPCTYIQQIEGPSPGSFLTGGTYKVTYALSDACGANNTCSFDIHVDGGLTIDCPADTVITAPANSNGVAVNWQEPTAFSCCSNCSSNGGSAIQGFIYMGAFDGHHYYCSTQPAEWNNAQTICNYNGGHLAVINSDAENQFLANLLTTQSAWIGLSDHQVEGTFEWVNDDAVGYTNWYPGQPNDYNFNQDYVELLNTGQWNDQYNSYSLEYIMELPGCLNVTQIAGPAQGSILAPGSSHVVTYQATDGCGNNTTCSFNIEVEPKIVNTTYCESTSVISSDYYIDSVVLDNINNQSGDDGGYGDYTLICNSFEQNQSYHIQLDPGYSTQPYDKVYWKVWIDYNMDGDFYDADEYVAYGCGTSTLNGVIVTPDILIPGETRMRIIMRPGAYPLDPCDNDFMHGETEDYCLDLWGIGTSNTQSGISTNSRNRNTAQLLVGDEELYDIAVYPNPAVDYITIEARNTDPISSIKMIDNQGKLIMTIDKESLIEASTIDVSNLESGIYLLVINEFYGETRTQKIIIQK